ncbi:ExbD/TolR family protein [Parasphingopyxis algicola]|uniref:ExbD/TolR family protein n=1 Tax=Parasphingopyxis algicola TaxID=2026624 RepID=UPI0015A20508|nr:ExbD/TolR family protein [Parasphingopyxis algicola]QLC25466.1 ExbD/TolR family protein [Parasphingopyxis algicola]
MAMQLPSQSMRGRRVPMSEINVTPFVDVMLVLLIIFMVTAPLLASGVPVRLPESRAGALDQESEPTQIAIDETGRIFIDDIAITDVELASTLSTIAARPSGPDGHAVFLRADTTLDYGRVMLVMGELNRAGLNRISLLTTAPGEEGATPDEADARSKDAPDGEEIELLDPAEVEPI